MRSGPINVSFKVTSDTFYFYSGGILPATICTNGKVNLSMLAIGYGQQRGIEYAIV